MKITEADPSRGILDFDRALRKFSLERFARPPALEPWIEGFWQVSWDLPAAEEHVQTNLAEANVHIVAEGDGAWLYGVPGRLFVRKISGRGRVFGIKFRPGAFHAFSGGDVSRMAGLRLPLDKFWGEAGATWGRAMLAAVTDAARVELSVGLVSGRLPKAPARSTALAERLIRDPSITSVAAAARALGLDERALERLFRAEVGLPPKQFLKRFRLQEAAERLVREPRLSCSSLALDLGYADQAHFTRDFRAVVGLPPETYRRRQVRPPSDPRPT
jgi:AraC-like DNA-binding protein